MLSFLSVVLISSPSYSSGITSNANSATCDNSTLETFTGTSNLTANWNANTINVTWYKDDTQFASNSCTYGGALTMPNDIPTKTGYTFAGWRVRQAQCSFAQSVCGLNGSAVNGLTYDSEDASAFGSYPHNGVFVQNASTYGLTTPGTWAARDTSGGIIKGIASCNSTMPTIMNTVMTAMENGTMTFEDAQQASWGTCNNDMFKPSNTFSNTSNLNNGDQYCWCKMESYTPNNGSACNVASPSWVFCTDADSVPDCESACTSYCAMMISLYGDVFRRAVFGVSQ